MSERKCDWVFLPSLDEPNERGCFPPAVGDSRYCAAHREEMLLAEAELAASSYGIRFMEWLGYKLVQRRRI